MKQEFYLQQNKLLQSLPWYRNFWVFWAIYSTLLFYAYFAYCLLAREFRQAFAIAISFIAVRLVLCELIYLRVRKQRPFKRFGFVPVVPKSIPAILMNIVDKRDDSMPSAHSASMAAIASVIFMFSPIWGLAFFTVAVLTGIGRITVGYHYPSDVLAGWALGLLTGFVAYFWLVPWLFTL